MQSVIEVSRRREKSRQRPPSVFYGNHYKNENNSSNVSSVRPEPHPPQIIHRYSMCHSEKDNGKPRNPKTWNHLMPVLLIEKKRATARSNPPGFCNPCIRDSNNNAKNATDTVKPSSSAKGDNSGKTMSTTKGNSSGKAKSKGIAPNSKTKGGKSATAKAKSTTGKNKTKGGNSASTKANIDSVKKNPVIDCITALKSNDSEPYLVKLTPDCLRGKDSTTGMPGPTLLKNLIKPQKKTSDRVKTEVYQTELTGEIIHVNVLEQISSDETEWSFLLDDRLSPENYEQTCLYYDHEIHRRREVRKAQQVLGYMLVDEEVEGDRDEWIQYTEKCAKEVKEWRDKCRESHAYFEKTIKIIGQEPPPSFYNRAIRFLKEAGQKVKKACPCVFNGT